MARKPSVGIVALDDANNTIDFVSLQEPTQTDPKKAKLKAGQKEWVVWNIENYFKEPGSLYVTLTFDWKENEAGAPFKKNVIRKKVDNLDGDGPGIATIREKVENGATIGKPYKYEILVEAKGLKLDPVLEIDDGIAG